MSRGERKAMIARDRPGLSLSRVSQVSVAAVFIPIFKGMAIERPNQVWCADITYIPVRRGFLYLVAIMDWATRQSNTMDASFCVTWLKRWADTAGHGGDLHGRPGSLYIFIERLWRSLKYEAVYLVRCNA